MSPKTADELKRTTLGLENQGTNLELSNVKVEANGGEVRPHDRSVVGNIGSHLDITSARPGHQAKWSLRRHAPQNQLAQVGPTHKTRVVSGDAITYRRGG